MTTKPKPPRVSPIKVEQSCVNGADLYYGNIRLSITSYNDELTTEEAALLDVLEIALKEHASK